MATLRLALMALTWALVGCAEAPRTLIVHPLAHTNHDRHFYLVVRALKEEEFVSDGYQKIASLVFPAAADPSVRLVRLVRPGRDDKLELALPDGQPYAVYALFTDPGDSWKVLLTPPLAPRYELLLDGNRLQVRASGQPARKVALPSLEKTGLEVPTVEVPK